MWNQNTVGHIQPRKSFTNITEATAEMNMALIFRNKTSNVIISTQLLFQITM